MPLDATAKSFSLFIFYSLLKSCLVVFFVVSSPEPGPCPGLGVHFGVGGGLLECRASWDGFLRDSFRFL